MHDILKERLWRKLQALPQEQLYQALDYIEFLEAKYAKEQALKAGPHPEIRRTPRGRHALRSVAPKVITGTVGLLGTARKVLRTVSDAGREILEAARPRRPAAPPGPAPAERLHRPAPRRVTEATATGRRIARPRADGMKRITIGRRRRRRAAAISRAACCASCRSSSSSSFA
jgi:hypothetical protein